MSRVFTPGASVSDRTRAKVVAAAATLGYRPNLIASSLITGKSRIVGVVVPGLTNPFYAALVDTLSDALSVREYRVMVFTARHGTSADPILEEILRYRLDALVLVSAQLSSRLAEECAEVGLPVVMVNRKTDSEAVSSVTGDNRAGAACIGSFLVAGGWDPRRCLQWSRPIGGATHRQWSTSRARLRSPASEWTVTNRRAHGVDAASETINQPDLNQRGTYV